MHWIFLTEEPSAEAALRCLWPRLNAIDTLDVIRHQGKPDLLKKLPSRLRAYSKWIPTDWRIVVLIDLDDWEDCQASKAELEGIATAADLVTKSRAESDRTVQIINRLAIKELEAWFFGDVEALVRAYPGVPPTLGEKVRFRDPDAIPQTSEALEQILRRAGYYAAGMPKTEVARRVARHMQPDRNRSKSFQVFRDAVRAEIPSQERRSQG